MGNSISSRALDNTLTAPPGYKVPDFPSLYNPRLELAYAGMPGDRPGTHYLYDSYGTCAYPLDILQHTIQFFVDIFRFTLYWTLLLYCPMYLLCGLYGQIIQITTKRHFSGMAILAPLIYTLVGLFFAVASSAVVGQSIPFAFS